jgi:type I restriction enzyme, R subunit
MITEDQLEQLAIQWFQDTGWSYVHGAVIAPEGVAAERENFRAVVLTVRLAEAVQRLNPKLPFFSRTLSGMKAAQNSSKEVSDHG